MNTRAFIVTLIGVIILGVGFGGSFIGGFAYGRTQEPVELEPSFSIPAPQRGQQGAAVLQVQQIDPAQIERFRQAVAQGGQAGQPTGAFGRQSAAMTGAIESVDDQTITVNTRQGPMTAAVTSDTQVRGFVEMSLAALEPGVPVAVTGDPDDAGVLQAASITVLPDDQVPGLNDRTGVDDPGGGQRSGAGPGNQTP